MLGVRGQGQSSQFIHYTTPLPSLASQPPCAHARMISGWGEGRENTSGDYGRDFVSLWNVIISKITVVAYLQVLVGNRPVLQTLHL